SGSTLDRLLADLLDVTRLEGRAIQINSAPFNLATLVGDAVERLAPKAASKGLAVHTELAPDADALFLGDEPRISQILTNLLSNAIKFTAAGEGRVAVGLAGGRARITVADTGVGFHPGDKGRLFARFEQADGSITRRFGGAGLGL